MDAKILKEIVLAENEGAVNSDNHVNAENEHLKETEEIESISTAENSVRHRLIYLTSDAEETIETLDVSCTYIIGGIVDRNRLKGATYKKACSQNIKTAKLPIKENLTSLQSTHVLTVNHVIEILLNYMKFHSWSEAIKLAIPIRKTKLSRKQRRQKKGHLNKIDDDGNLVITTNCDNNV